jgi:hypothetical protein
MGRDEDQVGDGCWYSSRPRVGRTNRHCLQMCLSIQEQYRQEGRTRESQYIQQGIRGGGYIVVDVGSPTWINLHTGISICCDGTD